MTEKSLQKSFSQHGVIKYGAVGDVFDPALHDALFAVPDATKTSGNIDMSLAVCLSFPILWDYRIICNYG